MFSCRYFEKVHGSLGASSRAVCVYICDRGRKRHPALQWRGLAPQRVASNLMFFWASDLSASAQTECVWRECVTSETKKREVKSVADFSHFKGVDFLVGDTKYCKKALIEGTLYDVWPLKLNYTTGILKNKTKKNSPCFAFNHSHLSSKYNISICISTHQVNSACCCFSLTEPKWATRLIDR